MKIELNTSEIESLKALLWFHEKACSNGCVYDDMQNSKLDCNNCRYMKDIDSIILKLESVL